MVDGINLLIMGLILHLPTMTMTIIRTMRESILGKLTIGTIITTVRINYIILLTDLKKTIYARFLSVETSLKVPYFKGTFILFHITE
jgi:hypothetical protein